MDEETVTLIFGFLLIVGLMVGIPGLLLLSIFSCISWGKVRKWKKEKALRQNNLELDVERENLVQRERQQGEEQESDDSHSSDDDDDDEPLDSEDEAELCARKEAEKPDWHLTTAQKFRKELKKAWRGQGEKDLAKKREREEAAKIAKAVAKGIARHERRRDREARRAARRMLQAGGESSATTATGGRILEDGLPSYNNAVAAAAAAAAGDVKR